MLERAPAVANAWRNQRWDSFTLVTPNFQVRMPGAEYSGKRSIRVHAPISEEKMKEKSAGASAVAERHCTKFMTLCNLLIINEDIGGGDGS
jgi:hypothetical protein